MRWIGSIRSSSGRSVRPGPVLARRALLVLVAALAVGWPAGAAVAQREASLAACQPGQTPAPPSNKVLRVCFGLTPKESLQVIENGDGVFKLTSPFIGADIKKPVLCGSDGCI